jgi:hypothetical protein
LAILSLALVASAALGFAATKVFPAHPITMARFDSQHATMPYPTATPPSIQLDPQGWTAWSLLDLNTNTRLGSTNSRTETNNAESVIKAWIATDYVSRVEAEGRALTTEEQTLLETMIRYSDDAAAETLYVSAGGDAVIQRLIDECGLNNTGIVSGWWSYTSITADDTVTMLRCILDRAKTSPLTAWVVDEMRHVDPSGSFGISRALPSPTQANAVVKNGWTLHDDGLWRVNCLTSWNHWALSVLTRYPAELGQEHGAKVCRSVMRQLVRHGLE